MSNASWCIVLETVRVHEFISEEQVPSQGIS